MKLESKRRGRPLLLGDELDKRVQLYIKALREAGAVINTSITMAVSKALIATCLRLMVSILSVASIGKIFSYNAWGM